MGFVAGLPPVILKTVEGLSGTRRVLIDVGRSLKLTGPADVPENPVPGGAADHLRRGPASGLIFTLINVVGVEFLINFAASASSSTTSRSATICPAPMPRSAS